MEYGAAAIAQRPSLPDAPVETAHVWVMFTDLSNARSVNEPISYQDIEAYGRITGMMPTPWEAGQIKRLDGMALQHWAEQATKEGRAKSRASGRDPDGVRNVLRGAARRG